MKIELFPFQQHAVDKLRLMTAEAMNSFQRIHVPQVVSFTAPTGAGKTIIMASLMEDIFCGTDNYPDQSEAIFIWLSDSPELNLQSKSKIDLKADRITLNQCVVIADESFDQSELEDGHIYFLNTQKLGKSSNLTKHSDGRQYTIWETIQNTIENKSDRLYVIVDEAHRGMQEDRDLARATTIMQKFVKGSPKDGLTQVPVLIGMSATTERFDNLIKGTSSTVQKVEVTAEEVRQSGLLKDTIVITYPEDIGNSNEMSLLQAAVDEWQHKCAHWHQYLVEQHYAIFTPVFVIQVLAGTSKSISDSPLDEILAKIEDRIGRSFDAGEVVHTFGQTQGSISINGLDVQYLEPSRIAETKQVKVVFFKENLSTGWDCPRAETMLSFRKAKDHTYIAQLLGRMVRTPMQMHIQVDDTLNDVHLYLPYFNRDAVQEVVDNLQKAEGGAIPADIEMESYDDGPKQVLSIKPKVIVKKTISVPSKQPVAPSAPTPVVTAPTVSADVPVQPTTSPKPVQPVPSSEQTTNKEQSKPSEENSQDTPVPNQPEATDAVYVEEAITIDDGINREEVIEYINNSDIINYDVRTVKITKNHVSSLFALVQILSMTAKWQEGPTVIKHEICEKIQAHAQALIDSGKYEVVAKKVKEFKVTNVYFNPFGEIVDAPTTPMQTVAATAESDIERQFRLADRQLGETGIGNTYLVKFATEEEQDEYDYTRLMIDVIIFANDAECIRLLNEYAKDRFNKIDDEYRRKMNLLKGEDEKYKTQYNSIVSNSALISKHIFSLPETIMGTDRNGTNFAKHLFTDDKGNARYKLNNWEKQTIETEMARPDFVTWYRNPVRKSFSLTIPYEFEKETKAMYPDFFIVRRDGDSGYIVDLLEPHNPTLIDNLPKAQGLAKYAEDAPMFGRIQLIRVVDSHLIRLDFTKRAIREKVKHFTSDEELNHLFDTDGIEE